MNTLLIIALFTAPPAEKTITGKVVNISDGDTCWILDDQNTRHKILLSAIDTPDRKQPFYKQASKSLGKKIHEKRVTVKWKKKDRYGRIIGDIWLDGRHINKEMVADGWAWHYVKYSKSKELAKAENEAREKKKGLWSGSEEPVAPWEWRKEQWIKAKKKAAAINEPEDGGWSEDPDKLLKHLNSWYKDELELYENPQKYPSNLVPHGETVGWIFAHKEKFERMNLEIIWDRKKKEYVFKEQ